MARADKAADVATIAEHFRTSTATVLPASASGGATIRTRG